MLQKPFDFAFTLKRTHYHIKRGLCELAPNVKGKKDRWETWGCFSCFSCIFVTFRPIYSSFLSYFKTTNHFELAVAPLYARKVTLRDISRCRTRSKMYKGAPICEETSRDISHCKVTLCKKAVFTRY